MHYSIYVIFTKITSITLISVRTAAYTSPIGVMAYLLIVSTITEFDTFCTPRPSPYPEPVYTGWSSVHWNATGMPLVDPVYTGTPLEKKLKQPHTGMPLEKLSWIRPTLGCHWRNSNFYSIHWNATGGTVTAHTRPDAYSLTCRVSSIASLKWQDGGTPVSKWIGLCIFSLYLEFTALQ